MSVQEECFSYKCCKVYQLSINTYLLALIYLTQEANQLQHIYCKG